MTRYRWAWLVAPEMLLACAPAPPPGADVATSSFADARVRADDLRAPEVVAPVGPGDVVAIADLRGGHAEVATARDGQEDLLSLDDALGDDVSLLDTDVTVVRAEVTEAPDADAVGAAQDGMVDGSAVDDGGAAMDPDVLDDTTTDIGDPVEADSTSPEPDDLGVGDDLVIVDGDTGSAGADDTTSTAPDMSEVGVAEDADASLVEMDVDFATDVELLPDVVPADVVDDLWSELADVVATDDTSTAPDDLAEPPDAPGLDVPPEPPVVTIPACSETSGVPPCLRWRQSIWRGAFATAPLPVAAADNPEREPLRAPTAATLAFDGRVLVGGGDSLLYDGEFYDESIVWEFDSAGAMTATPLEFGAVTAPIDCISVHDGSTYFVNEGGMLSWWPVGSMAEFWQSFIFLDVAPAWRHTCPAASDVPGWIVTAGGGILLSQVNPWTGFNHKERRFGHTANDRGPILGGGWTITGYDVYEISFFDAQCYDTGCTGDFLGTGTSAGMPIPSGLAMDSNSYVVIGTAPQVLFVAGIEGEPMQPAGAFAATTVVGPGDVAIIGSTNGYLYAIWTGDPGLAGLQWSVDTGASIRSAATVSGNGLVYVANEAPELLAIRFDTGEIVWRVDLPGRPAQDSYPLTSEGYLYVTAGTELLALQVEPGGLAVAPWPKTGFDNHNRQNQNLDPDMPQY